MNSSYDRWLTTPPDDNEPEIPLCEACGHEMSSVYPDGSDPHCFNRFCPDKHVEIMKEMAELIVDQAETIDGLKTKIHRLERKLKIDDFLLEVKK